MGLAVVSVAGTSELRKTMLRVALAALALLMVPAVASRMVAGWNWPAKAFVLVYFLFFVVGMAYALIARRMDAWSYKAGVGVALATGFVMTWSNMVQVADSGQPVNLLYNGVLVVGIVGVLLARLKARGLAHTLFVMVATLALIAVVLPSVAPSHLARNMAIKQGIFVMLFAASGLLFRHAGLAESK